MGEGGSLKKSPWFDRCEFSGGRVSTPTFRGWRFSPEFESFRGNGSSESTRFPEGLVLRNLGENLTPTERQICQSLRESTVYFRKIETCEDLEPWTCEDLEPWTCEDLESWTNEALESWTCEIVGSNPRSSGSTDGKFRNQKEAKSKTLPRKVWVWHVN
jgi:hypothetical protein